MKKPHRFLLSLTACAAFSTTSGHAASVAYDFNGTQADFNTNFLENTSGGTPAWASAGITATGGVNNTGYLATSSNTQSALFDQSNTWTVGQTYTMSVYFKARVTATSVPAGGTIRLGIGDDNAATLSGGEYVSATIVSGATGDSSRLALISRQSGTNTTSGVDLGVLTDNNWYEYTAAFTKNATSGTIDATLTLFSWGADGVTGGSQVGTSSTLAATGLTNLYGSTGVYFGIGGASNGSANGVRGFDNFTVVPEPSSSMLMFGGVGAMLFVRRRRHA